MIADAVVGMQGVVSALTDTSTGLTSASFFTLITDLVPFIVLMVPVALGLYFLRKMIKGAGKGKVRI